MPSSGALSLAWFLEQFERDVVHWFTCTAHSEALGRLLLSAQAWPVAVTLLGVGLAWIAWRDGRRALRATFAAGLGWCAAMLVADVMWITVDRPRPQESYARLLRAPEELEACASMPEALALRSSGSTSASFPSRHGLTVGVFVTALWLARRWIGALAAAYGLVVCAGRVYSGKHWPSDLLAGVLLGAVLAWLSWRAAPAVGRLARRMRCAPALPPDGPARPG